MIASAAMPVPRHHERGLTTLLSIGLALLTRHHHPRTGAPTTHAQARLLSIGLALLTRPAVLFIDEPESHEQH